MQTERTYQLRRVILTALKDCFPAPASLADILAHPSCQLLHPSRDELCLQFEELTARGYSRNVIGANGEYKSITPQGLDQINQETDRDIFIWGKYGLK